MATPSIPGPSDRPKWLAEALSDVKWAVALLFVFVFAFADFRWNLWDLPTNGEEDLGEVTSLIFSTDGLVAPFEILSVLLLAALIAGVVIAFRDPEDASEPEGGDR